MSRGEGADLLAQAHQVLSLTGKDDAPVVQMPVKQGPNADGIPGGDEAVGFVVVDDHGKFCVQPPEHIQPVLLVQRQNQLAVGLAAEGKAPLLHLPLQRPEAV